MSEQHASSGPVCEPDLDHHLEAFLAFLAQAGYAENTRRGKARRIAPFIQWTHTSGIRLYEVDDLDACIDAFLAGPSRRLYKHRCALQAFVAYLREAKVLPSRSMELSAAAALCQRYLEHLHRQQGLSDHSIAAYAVSVRGFIDAMRLPEEAAGLDALAIRRYLLTLSQQHAVATVKVYAAGLRSFLRFCLLKGLISRDLSTALPCIGRCQPKPMPPILPDEDIERVLATVDRSSLRGCREFAVLQLLMDGRGRALDNIFVERLWRSVKYEDIYPKGYETLPELLLGLSDYFAFYNNERPHQALGYRTPTDVHRCGTGGGAAIVDQFKDRAPGAPSAPLRFAEGVPDDALGQRQPAAIEVSGLT